MMTAAPIRESCLMSCVMFDVGLPTTAAWFGIWDLVLGICFGFGASDFGFWALRMPPSPSAARTNDASASICCPWDRKITFLQKEDASLKVAVVPDEKI